LFFIGKREQDFKILMRKFEFNFIHASVSVIKFLCKMIAAVKFVKLFEAAALNCRNGEFVHSSGPALRLELSVLRCNQTNCRLSSICVRKIIQLKTCI